MTVRITPQEISPTNQTTEPSEQPVFTYDDPIAEQSEAEYIPEREFVLMPLFRRIGQMLGIRRAEGPEYVYVPERASQQPVSDPQPEQVSAAPVQRLQVQSLQNEQEEEVEEAPVVTRAATEDILGIEQPPLAEPEVAGSMASALEIVGVPQAQLQQETDAAEMNEPSAPALDHSYVMESQLEPAMMEESILPEPPLVSASVRSPQAATPPSTLTPQEATDLAAQLREAANKISTAVAQAAEWLHSKEEEILHRAQMPAQPVAEALQAPQAMPVQASAVETPTQVPEWEEKEGVPALQRELAWQAEHAATVEQAGVSSAQPLKTTEPKRCLQVVTKPAALPFWKRIDWARQFAPKRVAMLGAFVMAILMVLGISLARRPASSALPEQTRAIEPGGVTLTTHAATPSTSLPAQSQAKLSGSRPIASPSRAHARAAGAEEDGPEVVTHYYGKPKPSPVHQAAASGVHHYSDLQ